MNTTSKVIISTNLGYLDHKAVKSVQTIGPYDESHATWCADRPKKLAFEAQEALAPLSDADLQNGFDPSGTPRSEFALGFARRFNAKNQELRDVPWYSGGLGHPAHEANYRHWSTMAYLTLPEAVCLTLGVAPYTFSEKELQEFSKTDYAAKGWPGQVRVFIGRRYEVLRRRFDPQTIGEVSISTLELTAWIHEVELEVPDKFRRSFQKRFEPLSMGKPSQEDARVDRRELKSIAKLLTVIAIEKYGYQPSSKRGRVPAKIKDTADRLGLEISEETILKFLRLGATSLPK